MATGNQVVEMADDQYRALLTEREEEILSEEADVSDNYRYRTISRVRSKIERLSHDVSVLEKHNPELLDELRDTVCEERSK
jgi:hypothetical protein